MVYATSNKASLISFHPAIDFAFRVFSCYCSLLWESMVSCTLYPMGSFYLFVNWWVKCQHNGNSHITLRPLFSFSTLTNFVIMLPYAYFSRNNQTTIECLHSFFQSDYSFFHSYYYAILHVFFSRVIVRLLASCESRNVISSNNPFHLYLARHDTFRKVK